MTTKSENETTPPAKKPARRSTKAQSNGRAGTTKAGTPRRGTAHSAHEKHQHQDPRPLAGYAVLSSGYAAIAGGLVLGLRAKRSRVRSLGPMDLLLYGLATEHIARLISKDSITSVFRAPFTEFKEPAGEGEVSEEVIGNGVRHALGELVSCPFCVGQWVATGLMAGQVAAPAFTTMVVSVSAVARVSDILQLLYGRLTSPVVG